MGSAIGAASPSCPRGLRPGSPKATADQFQIVVRCEMPGHGVIPAHRNRDPLAALDLVSEKIERRLRKKTAGLGSGWGPTHDCAGSQISGELKKSTRCKGADHVQVRNSRGMHMAGQGDSGDEFLGTMPPHLRELIPSFGLETAKASNYVECVESRFRSRSVSPCLAAGRIVAGEVSKIRDSGAKGHFPLSPNSHTPAGAPASPAVRSAAVDRSSRSHSCASTYRIYRRFPRAMACAAPREAEPDCRSRVLPGAGRSSSPIKTRNAEEVEDVCRDGGAWGAGNWAGSGGSEKG